MHSRSGAFSYDSLREADAAMLPGPVYTLGILSGERMLRLSLAIEKALQGGCGIGVDPTTCQVDSWKRWTFGFLIDIGGAD